MSRVRYRIIAVSMVMAFILYLDRICLAEIVKSASFLGDVGLNKVQIGRLLGAFFFSYALFQVPAGWISDRLGGRGTLTAYIVLWSLFTALTGMMSTFAGLLAMRLCCGMAEAGAYPTSNALIRRWIPLAGRARASSMITVGGRLGGTLAPFITAWLVVSLGHWRPVLWIDGAIGLAIAGLYWSVVRNRPAEHPACDGAERELIGQPPVEPRLAAREIVPMLRLFCRSRSLWFLSLLMFLVNVGWAYLITWLPTYLKEQRHVEAVAGGRLVTLVLACGMIGQLCGGWFADWSVRRFGLRHGRRLALGTSGLVAGSGYLACLGMSSTWSMILCFCAISFASDMGNPAMWAAMQDLGGRFTAAMTGWANMWGNFGSSVSALMVPALLVLGGGGLGQRYVFLACACALILSGVAAIGMDATRPVTDVGHPAGGAARNPLKP